MADAPTPPAPAAPMAGDGEQSVTGTNMKGSPVGVMPSAEVDYAKAASDAQEAMKSPVPLMMSDADATKVGREVESRYLPPPPVPTVLELIEKAKEAAAAPPPPPSA